MDSDAIQALTVETQPQPVSAVEALIHINNQLNQHEVYSLILLMTLYRNFYAVTFLDFDSRISTDVLKCIVAANVYGNHYLCKFFSLYHCGRLPWGS